MLTPIDIESKNFKKSSFGYDKKDVQAFIQIVLEDYEQLYKENRELHSKLDVTSASLDHYKNLEDSMNRAMVMSQKVADETKDTAEKSAKAIEDEARINADRIIADAVAKQEEINVKTQSLINQYEVYKANYKNLLKSQIDIISTDTFNIGITSMGKDDCEDEEKDSLAQSENSREEESKTA